jgi:hypothetical protein
MINSFYKISLDIQDHGSHVSLKAKKGDTGRILKITLVDGGKPYKITSECLAVFTAKKADGTLIYNGCSIIDNAIFYVFTEQTALSVGTSNCEIKLYGSDEKLLTSASFTLIIEDTVLNESDLLSMNEVTALTKLVSDANTIIYEVNRKLANGEFVGPQGISGVVAPTTGHYVLEVDSATGDLYCVTEEGVTAPTFTMDEDGNIYYEIKEA